jgi:valyl-tRNA synthetase
MIEKTYQPAEVEGRIYDAWEKAGAFRAGRPERTAAEPYCIVIPPPNVTGSLHMGHALNNTLQDILCRFERMRGKDVLWQSGTDHAGIATQMVVERQLMERQEPGRREMGRDAFLKRVWEWKAESGGTIVNQLKRLGASCDWSRERFTMDEGLSQAVLKVFVQLYNEGLIYKDKRLVNWDPKLLTAISDLEVVQVECTGSFKWTAGGEEPFDAAKLGKVLDRNPNGHLYYIKYPLEGVTFDPNDASTFIVVATTRPETMLGDTAVAVHPENEKLKHLIGRNVILPLVGRRIPIVGDDYADPEKGTGAVKITPAHDFNDFEVGKRRNLLQINVLDREGKIAIEGNRAFWAHVRGAGDTSETDELINWTADFLERVDRFDARKKIIARLNERGFLDKIEPHTHMVPHGDRSNVVIEPYLTDQWYVDAKTLAKPALAAVRDGLTTFVPKNWEKTYFDWMENIQPWCVSRQLWWGHQIPAWYGRKEGPRVSGEKKSWLNIDDHPEIFVAETEAEAIQSARIKYGCDVRVVSRPIDDNDSIFQDVIDDEVSKKGHWEPIWRDEDVLDTWFSSALWPFSTLGWPDDTPEVKRFYPTSVLVTGFDIIFFWVARMMMMGLHFQKEVPFKDVYIHALVRDEKGAKMSKSKGNVIDPLALIDQYGADALRFTLAAMAAQGRDIKLATQRVEGYRNFATKLWNAARFVEFNGAARVAGFDPKAAKETLNRWIAHETAKAAREITAALEAYRFNEAAGAAYRFVWNVYCDWYVELSKPVLTGPDGAAKDETRATAAWALDEILKLLHPFMPFVTEELWGVTAGQGAPRGEGLLVLAQWPALEGLDDDRAEAEIGWVVDLVTSVRSLRSEMNITAAVPLVLVASGPESRARAERWAEFVKRLARVSELSFADAPPAGSVQLLVRGEAAALPLKGVIDFAAESARLQKELGKADADIAHVEKKLANPKFVANAAEELVEAEREKREEAVARRAKIAEALERLKGAA